MGGESIKGFIAILDFIEGINDENSIFPNGNKGMPIALKYWSEAFLGDGMSGVNINTHLSLISRQLDDGRDFLQGSKAGLADIFSYAPIHILSQQADNKISSAMGEHAGLVNWFSRMEKINS